MQACSTFVRWTHEGLPLQACSMSRILAVWRAGRGLGWRSGRTAQRQTEETEDHDAVKKQEHFVFTGLERLRATVAFLCVSYIYVLEARK